LEEESAVERVTYNAPWCRPQNKIQAALGFSVFLEKYILKVKGTYYLPHLSSSCWTLYAPTRPNTFSDYCQEYEECYISCL